MKNIKNWIVANIVMIFAVVLFSALAAATTYVFGGSLIKNGLLLGLGGVCGSLWYYATTKQAPITIKVLAAVVTLMCAAVAYGMHFIV